MGEKTGRWPTAALQRAADEKRKKEAEQKQMTRPIQDSGDKPAQNPPDTIEMEKKGTAA